MRILLHVILIIFATLTYAFNLVGTWELVSINVKICYFKSINLIFRAYLWKNYSPYYFGSLAFNWLARALGLLLKAICIPGMKRSQNLVLHRRLLYFLWCGQVYMFYSRFVVILFGNNDNRLLVDCPYTFFLSKWWWIGYGPSCFFHFISLVLVLSGS